MAYIEITDKTAKDVRKTVVGYGKFIEDFMKTFPDVQLNDLNWMIDLSLAIRCEEDFKNVKPWNNRRGWFLIRFEVKGKDVLVFANGVYVEICEIVDDDVIPKKRLSRDTRIDNIIKEIKKQF